MTLPFFFLLLSVNMACSHLSPMNQNRMYKERVHEQRRIDQNVIQDRQPRSVSTLKVLDFSADGDQQPDSNGEYTSATLEAGPLPESFTICSAWMVEAWTADSTAATLFQLLDNDGIDWLSSKRGSP